MDLNSFLAMPREYVDLMFRICDEEALVEGRDFHDVKDKLDKEFGA